MSLLWATSRARLRLGTAGIYAARCAVLIVGCGLLHELDAAPTGLTFHVADIDERAVAAVLARRDPRITGGTEGAPQQLQGYR